MRRCLIPFAWLSILTTIPPSAGGCLWSGPFADHSVHKTPFNTGWETVNLENVGVDIDLPRDPKTSKYPIYEIDSTYPNSTMIDMHRHLYRSMPEWGAMLRLSLHRQNRTSYAENLRSHDGKLSISATEWEPDHLFEGVHREHALIRKASPSEPAIYSWEFVRCYRAPSGDVIIVSCVYAMDDQEDIKAIEHMINSVRPTR